MYAYFEGTKEEIDESCSNKKLVEIHEEEVSTNRRKEENLFLKNMRKIIYV